MGDPMAALEETLSVAGAKSDNLVTERKGPVIVSREDINLPTFQRRLQRESTGDSTKRPDKTQRHHKKEKKRREREGAFPSRSRSRDRKDCLSPVRAREGP